MTKPKPSQVVKTASLAVLESVKLALGYHQNAESTFRQGAAFAGLAGLELKQQKKELKHGLWEAFQAEHYGDKLPERTVRYYMTVAEGLKVKAKDRPALDQLLASPAGQLTDEKRVRLAKMVQGIADGETMASLIEAYRISKRPKGASVEGGYRPDPAKLAEFLGAYHTALVGTPYENLAEDVQAHFRKWAAQRLEDPGQMAFDFCRPVLDAFEHPDFAGLLRQLPDAEKQRMLDHAEAMVRQLRDDLRESTRKAA